MAGFSPPGSIPVASVPVGSLVPGRVYPLIGAIQVVGITPLVNGVTETNVSQIVRETLSVKSQPSTAIHQLVRETLRDPSSLLGTDVQICILW